MAKLPLEGIRILDITIVFSGPWSTMLLADMGAEVIRVESLQRFPKMTRGLFARPSKEIMEMLGPLGAGYPDMEPGDKPFNRSAIFTSHSRNKLSMTVDLTQPKGVEIFKRLVKVSDGIIENNAAYTMENLGLGYDVLKEINPGLIYVRQSGWGLTGPYRNYVGVGVVGEAMSGHLLLRGYPDLDYTTLGSSFAADAAAGCANALGFMLALHHRKKTGKGQLVDVSLLESFVPQLLGAFMDYGMNRRIQKTLGNRHHSMAPHGCYRCKGEDSWVNICISSDEEWQGFCRAMGDPPWTKEERFADVVSRHKNQDELDRHIEEWTSQRDKFEVMHMLQAEGVPAGAVMDSKDAYNDPHLRERGWPVPLTHREAGTHEYPGLVWKMSKTPGSLRFAAPCLGEHNEYVYKELLKVSDEEYAELEKEGHIGDDFLPYVF